MKHSMRATLILALVVALAASVCLPLAAPLRAGPPNRKRHHYGPPDIKAKENGEYFSLAGLDADEFQKFLDEARDKGYQPDYVNGYSVGDHVEYAGVAVKDPDRVSFKCRCDLTGDDCRDFLRDMRDKGFRPSFLSGYHTQHGTRFAAVCIKDDRPIRTEYRLDQTRKEYERTTTDMRDDRMHQRCVTAYQSPEGGVRFTSVFVPDGADGEYDAKHDLTGGQLDDQVDRWRDDGFRVVRVHAYDTQDGLRFLATAVKARRDRGSATKVFRGLTGEEYQKKFDALAGDGFLPICICGYAQDGDLRFAAVWFKKG